MITGTVTSDREAVLEVTVFGPTGRSLVVSVVLDTGFTGCLSLPATIIQTLGLPWRRMTGAALADGHETVLDVFEATVLWDSSRVTVPVVASDDGDPLIGMSLIYGYELRLPVMDGSPFQLSKIV